MELEKEEQMKSKQHELKEVHTKTHYKMSKIRDKERILKAAREKLVTYKRTPIRLSAGFSAETLQARREWHNIFKE